MSRALRRRSAAIGLLLAPLALAPVVGPASGRAAPPRAPTAASGRAAPPASARAPTAASATAPPAPSATPPVDPPTPTPTPTPAAPDGTPCSPAPPNGVLGVSTNRTGLVDLFFFNARGAPVTYYECAGGRAYRLGVRSMADAATTPMLGATQWRCDRLSRYFAATVTLPDGSPLRGLTSVRTMSCARRFALEVPRRIAPGQEARVRVVDRWGIGAI
ncbi:MAG: hypothetical protein QOD61_2400, partial [Solirubrobacteraceae bacterium]|nr:hypothetical protein [Solirubrobacteraceae bacterium]